MCCVVLCLLRIASFSHHHRGLVLALWLAVLVGGFAAAPSLFGALSSDVGDIDDTEAARADQALWDAAPTGEEIYAVVDGLPATDAALRQEVDTAARRLAAIHDQRLAAAQLELAAGTLAPGSEVLQ